MSKRKHPMQPIDLDNRNKPRFRENKIVRFLLDQYDPGLDGLINSFARSGDPVKDEDDRADYEQLMMLIGYTVSGFAELPSSSPKTVAAADKKAAQLLEAAEKA